MRLWLLSDLHDEIAPYNSDYYGAPPDVDVCLAAGDITRGGRAHVEFLQEFIAPHTRLGVVSCLGNHEFYRSSIERERIEAGRASARGDVHVLDDMVWTIGDVRFIGATLWTSYDLWNPSENPIIRDGYMATARHGLNDHKKIRLVDSNSRYFIPQHAREIHKKSVAYLDSVLSEPFDGQTVVISHHAPAKGSIAPKYADDVLTAAYVSRLEWLIEKHQPALWVHGHVHTSFDYHVGSTRIVANPHGYGLENKRGFDPRLVIDLDDLAPKPLAP